MTEAILKALLSPKERPLDEPCRRCGEKALVLIQAPGWGPWGGAVECKACSQRNTVVAHVGKQMISVEPLEG